MDDAFDAGADALKLRPEHLKRLKAVAAGAAKAGRRREFVRISREQSDRLDKAKNSATEIVFRHLLFLDWRSPGRTIRLPNVALESKGVYRQAKTRALIELRRLGLIKLRMRPRKSPEIVIRNL